MSKKDERERQRVFELIKQAQERKARADSQARQASIKVLLDLIVSGKLVPNDEESEDTAKDLKNEVEELFAELTSEETFDRPVRDENHKSRITNEPVRSLGELVALQKCEIEYLRQLERKWEQILAYDREGLENLYNKSLSALVQANIEKQLAEEKGKKGYERKRRRYRGGSAGVGLIEYQFGGAGEAEWRKSALLSVLLGQHYQPSCLDDILLGGVGEVKTLPGIDGPVPNPPITVDTRPNMRRLEALFGMDRKRFPCGLRGREVGREVLYDWRAVVKIMRVLLKPRERKKLGAKLRIWLEKPALRAKVLSAIEERINVVCKDGEIAHEFRALIQEFKAS